MAAAGAFDVVHVNGAARDGRHGILAEPEFVDGVGVEMDGEVASVRGRERTMDHRGRGAEILMDFDAQSATRDTFRHRAGVRAPAPRKPKLRQ